MEDHSLHDCSLHGYESITATLKDGRKVYVEFNPETGTLDIIGNVGGDEEKPEAPKRPALGQTFTPAAAPNMLVPKFVPVPGTDPPETGPGAGQSAPDYVEDLRQMWQVGSTFSSSAISQKILDMMAMGNRLGVGGAPVPQNPDVTIIPTDNAFRAALNSVMNDNKFDRRLRGRSRGKLDMTHLYKAHTGSTSVFTQKTLRRNRDYRIVLAIDESGSMAGPRIEMASYMAQFLAQHLDKVEGVELAILGYDMMRYVHKEFDQVRPLETLANEIRRTGGGGTNAENALLKCGQLLKPYPDARKIVLFLADDATPGKPFMRDLHAQNPDTLLVGIGIEVTPKHFNQSFTVREMSDLVPNTLSVLRRNIRRG